MLGEKVLANIAQESQADAAASKARGERSVEERHQDLEGHLGDIYHAGTGLERQAKGVDSMRQAEEAAEARRGKAIQSFKGSLQDKAFAPVTGAFHPHPLVLKTAPPGRHEEEEEEQEEEDWRCAGCGDAQILEEKHSHYRCEHVGMKWEAGVQCPDPCGYRLCQECYAIAYMEAYRAMNDPDPPPPPMDHPVLSTRLEGPPPWMMDRSIHPREGGRAYPSAYPLASSRGERRARQRAAANMF